jgi:DNA-binding NtrC family response regulator
VLLEYEWPGNARQLRNTIERAVVLSDRAEIAPEALPEEILSGQGRGRPTTDLKADRIAEYRSLDFRTAKKEFERQFVEDTLDQTGGNVTRAAARLGMHRQSLQHKIKELGLTKRFVSDD